MPRIYSDTPILNFRPTDCRNCYKCVRNCPVKAIRIRDHRAQIIADQCIHCERCTLVCPQNAKEEWNMTSEIQKSIQSGKKVLASLHPSYLAEFGSGSLPSLEKAMKKAGFQGVFDACEGAYLMRRRYEEILRERKQTVPTISSNCPVIVQLVEKHYPELTPYLAPSLSMMQAHAKYLKKKYPDAEIVSVSPCISGMEWLKKPENYTDYVITFPELRLWLETEGIALSSDRAQDAPLLSRLTAVSGGLTRIMEIPSGQRRVILHGVDNCREALDELSAGGYQDCFLELNACPNGCIGGPSFEREKKGVLRALTELQNASLFQGNVDPGHDCQITDAPDVGHTFSAFLMRRTEAADEEEIRKVLEQMGKYAPEDELNCGACGYETCREKAAAVINGKAEISMCVPFMRKRQQSVTNKIINAMPGLLITVDYDFRIVYINKAARDLFDPLHAKKLIGTPISELMDDFALINLVSFDKNISHDQIFLEERALHLDRILTNDRKNRLILCVMEDITQEIQEQRRVAKAQAEAAAMADRLVEEQLKIVQEIAGLLGETAADTKVAVAELKRTIFREQGDTKKNGQ